MLYAGLDRFGTEIGAARAGDDLLRKVFPKFDEAVLAAEDGEPKAALLLA